MQAGSAQQPWTPEQSDVLAHFQWHDVSVDERFFVDALGVRTRRAFYAGRDWSGSLSERFAPTLNEAVFEWIGVLEAVLRARGHFTMLELGLGYARWLVTAAYALKQKDSLPMTLIGVEAEPTHFRWAQQHISDNGIDPGSVELIHAAVGAEAGPAKFYTGMPGAWYGQAVAEGVNLTPLWLRLARKIARRPRRLMDTVERVQMITLNSILQDLDHVDLIHMDVQGAELATLTAASKEVDSKVASLVIGTHSEAVEAGLRELLGGLGWQNIYDYSLGRWHETPYGRIEFPADGLQTWHNPRFQQQ